MSPPGSNTSEPQKRAVRILLECFLVMMTVLYSIYGSVKVVEKYDTRLLYQLLWSKAQG